MTTERLRAAIQWGLLIIVALMPFHAFLSIWFGSLTGNQEAWQSWKELLALALTGMSAVYAYKHPAALQRLRSPFWYALAAFSVVAVVVTVVMRPGIIATLFGAKTDLEPLVLCVVAALVADKGFVRRLVAALLTTSSAVIVLALLQVYVLPKEFLTNFGYGASTIAPYMLIDPALDDIRAFATLGGALQLGSFLILPLALIAALMTQRFRWWQPILLTAAVLAVWHTHSRAAWGGALVALGIVAVLSVPKRWRLPFILGGTVIAAIGLNLLISLAGNSATLQYYLFHGSLKETGYTTSTDQHGLAIENGQRVLLDNPLGKGLGTAGPASYQTDDPIIPESQYLQIGIEAGFIGLAFYLLFQLLLAWRLLKDSEHQPLAAALLASLGGVAVINLALHGWADSSTALVYWTIAGAYLGSRS